VAANGERELRFAVRLTPRAGADRVDGVTDGVLRCRVAAAPADGAANDALLRLLARELDLPPSALRLVAGATARRKLVGLDAGHRARLIGRWPGLVP
jgi:uncharacterized protein YggU (UPF0235/DUF167 family)